VSAPFLTPRRRRALEALAARIVPEAAFRRSPDLPPVSARVETFLSETRPDLARGFAQLLLFFEYATFFFTLRFRRFSALPPEAQDRYLAGFERSRFYWRRALILAVKVVLMVLFYEDPAVEAALGYDRRGVLPEAEWRARGAPALSSSPPLPSSSPLSSASPSSESSSPPSSAPPSSSSSSSGTAA
jgi:hypothetical protein